MPFWKFKMDYLFYPEFVNIMLSETVVEMRKRLQAYINK